MSRKVKDEGAQAPAPRTTGTKVALIQAAREEFATQGYAGATTREIARRAGTSEVMLFRHYGSKANLFKEAVFQPFDQSISEFIANELPPEAPKVLSATAWRTYSGALFSLLEENSDLLNVLIAACNYDSDEIVGVHDLTSFERYFEAATNSLARNTDDENYERTENPEILVRLIFGMMASIALFRSWLFPPEIAPLEKVVDTMQRFVEQAYGISTLDRPK